MRSAMADLLNAYAAVFVAGHVFADDPDKWMPVPEGRPGDVARDVCNAAVLDTQAMPVVSWQAADGKWYCDDITPHGQDTAYYVGGRKEAWDAAWGMTEEGRWLWA